MKIDRDDGTANACVGMLDHLVAVSHEKWSPEDVTVAAQKAHHYLTRRRHPVRVAYASFAQLAADPASSDIAGKLTTATVA